MKFNNRTVVGLEIDGVDFRDYPDFCDAYFSNAYYEDTGEPLTDRELDELGDLYPDVLNEMALDL